jgi:hypothetical protein
MGIRHDVEQGLKKYKIMKIDGQPMDEDLNLLVKELTNAAGSIATDNGGGEHGHVGMVIDEAEYITFSRSGARLIVPTNPGAYPTPSMQTKSSVNVKSRNTRRNASHMKPTLASKTTFAG